VEPREAPAACEAASRLPCDRETSHAADIAAVSPQVRPVARMGLRGPSRGARASCDGVAKPATETLRLPALHQRMSGLPDIRQVNRCRVTRYRPLKSAGSYAACSGHSANAASRVLAKK
jgi:hypothetical protein